MSDPPSLPATVQAPDPDTGDLRAETYDVGGLPNIAVVVIKGVLYAIALAGLVLASRSAIARQGAA